MNTSRKNILLATYLTLVACGGGGGASDNGGGQQPAPVVVATVIIEPDAVFLEIGATTQLRAVARTAAGQIVSGVTVEWTTDDQAVATVTGNGLVEARGVGRTPLRARVGAIEGRIDVNVEAPTSEPVVSVQISPPQAIVKEGEATQFAAIAYDGSGKVITGRGENWTSGDASIAFVEPLGRTTGLRVGSTTVNVKIDGQSATASIDVQADYTYSLVYNRSENFAPPQVHTLAFADPTAMPVPLFAGRSARDPTPSPDGMALAFIVTSVTGDSHVYRANRDGTNVIQLTTGSGRRDHPAWSPDSARIAYRDRETGFGTDIWTMSSADGSDAVNLTADMGPTSQSYPTWSPAMIGSSYRIAFSHSDSGQGHIWSMRSDGTDKQELTSSTTAYDDQPSWSPDGNTLAFQRSSVSIFGDIYRVDAILGGAGIALMPVIGPLAGPQFAPAWSPDGQLVAFTSRHATDEYQVYTVWADGTRLAQRTFGGEHENPAFISD